MPSWIGPWEIAIVLVIALLIFGPKKLPDLGSSLGKSISGFKRGLKDAQDEVKTAMSEDSAEAPASVEAPAVNPAPTATTTTTAAAAEPAAAATATATAAETEKSTEQS
jgi:sec-independent protein translocase protein TatA